MRALLCGSALLAAVALTACPGRSPSIVDDGRIDAGSPAVDGGTEPGPDAGEPGPDGGTAPVSCVDSPNDLPRPSTALPCELVPPALNP